MESSEPYPSSSGMINRGISCSSSSTIMCCEFNKDGSLVAVGTSNGTIAMYQPSTGAMLYNLNLGLSKTLPVTSVRFVDKKSNDQEGILIASYAAGVVCKWHFSTGQCLATVNESVQSLAVAIAPTACTFSTAGSDGKLHVYDTTTCDKKRTLESSLASSVMDGHVSRVFALTYHPLDPNILLSAGWDDTVQIWDVRKQRSIRKISGPHICGDGLDIHPSTFKVVTGSWRYHDTIQVWDFHSGKLITTYEGELKTKVYAVRWVHDHLLVGGIKENQAVLLDPQTNKDFGWLMDAQHGVYAVDYCSPLNLAAIAEGCNLHLATLSANSEHAFITQQEL